VVKAGTNQSADEALSGAAFLKPCTTTTTIAFHPKLDYFTYFTEAEFLVPDWGDKVDFGIGGCGTGPLGYVGWRAGTTLC